MKEVVPATNREKALNYGVRAAFIANDDRDRMLIFKDKLDAINSLDLADYPELVQELVIDKRILLEREYQKHAKFFDISMETASEYLARDVEGSDTFFSQPDEVKNLT